VSFASVATRFCDGHGSRRESAPGRCNGGTLATPINPTRTLCAVCLAYVTSSYQGCRLVLLGAIRPAMRAGCAWLSLGHSTRTMLRRLSGSTYRQWGSSLRVQGTRAPSTAQRSDRESNRPSERSRRHLRGHSWRRQATLGMRLRRVGGFTFADLERSSGCPGGHDRKGRARLGSGPRQLARACCPPNASETRAGGSQTYRPIDVTSPERTEGCGRVHCVTGREACSIALRHGFCSPHRGRCCWLTLAPSWGVAPDPGCAENCVHGLGGCHVDLGVDQAATGCESGPSGRVKPGWRGSHRGVA
jgi:hypothetical protein